MDSDPGLPESIRIDVLMPQVYADLKRIAHRQLARLRPGDTLNTTALVHETYERLAPAGGAGLSSREHLLACCARAMRQILIDHARGRSAQKRGGGQALLDITDQELPDGSDPGKLLALDQALAQLESRDPRLVRLVELRVFAGFEPPAIAEMLGVNLRTVQRDWLRARAWIGAALQE